MSPLRIWRLASIAVAAVVVAAPAAAQGKGKKGSPPGKGAPDPVTSSPATAESRAIYLGSWLDDASVIEPGALWMALSTGYWRFGLARQMDFPIIDMAVGVGPRTHLGASIPMYHYDDGSGATASGVGEALLYGKLRLRDASTSEGRLGVAVTPVVEISSSIGGTSQQLSWAAPLSLEVRSGSTRVYGSGGYFSRGALFGSAGVEGSISRRVSITGTIGHTYSTATNPSADTLVDGRHRTDAGIGTSVSVTPAFAIFGAVGHSFSSGSTSVDGNWIAGGISLVTKSR